MQSDDQQVRIGILWRGDRNVESPAPRPDRQLGPLFDAFDKLGVEVVLVPFTDDAVDEVREELLICDGVLAWVNPIQDGANRAQVDAVLRDVAKAGVFVSAHPDVILKLGTKEILVQTRHLGWGSDTELYRTSDEFAERFPARLADHGRLVLKQGRGNGGNGVWKVELIEEQERAIGRDTVVRVQDARARDGVSEMTTLGRFLDLCKAYLEWSGVLVDQQYQERLADGMLRCYFTHDEVVGFCHQWPKGLLDLETGQERTPEPAPSVMEGPGVPAYQRLRALAEGEWVPAMKEVLGIEREALPVIWDADFLYGPKTEDGEDAYVLCEINVSAVWPFPAMAAESVARATIERSMAAEAARA